MSHAGLMIHVYSPLPLGKSQNDMYRKYVLESLRLIRVPDIMLPSDQLTSGSSTDSDTLAIELDSNSFKLFETEPSTRIVVQPDFTRLIGNMNSLVSTREIRLLNSSGNSLHYGSRETTGSVT